MKLLHGMIVVCLLAICCMANAADALSWYQNIQPFSTRDSIIAISGKPDIVDNGVDIYAMKIGQIKVRYDNGIISDCTYYNPGDCLSRNYYTMFNGHNDKTDGMTADEFINSKQYTIIPNIVGKAVITHMIPGLCYKTSKGVISIKPIIGLMGGIGYFADKTEKVVYYEDSKTVVLYRAFDNWRSLIPKGVDENELNRRKREIELSGLNPSIGNLLRVLGQADSVMGSGIGYKLYYLDSGLLILSDYHAIDSINVFRPGY